MDDFLCPFCNTKAAIGCYSTERSSISYCGDEACREKAWDRFEELNDYEEDED